MRKKSNIFKVIVFDKESKRFIAKDMLIKRCKASKAQNEHMERLCDVLNNPLPPHEIQIKGQTI